MRISDWSSDVCSSDLRLWPLCGAVGGDQPARKNLRHRHDQRDAAHRAAIGNRCRRRGGATHRDAVRRHPLSDRRGAERRLDRKSVVEGKSVSVLVDLGGGRVIKKKKASTKQAGNEGEK